MSGKVTWPRGDDPLVKTIQPLAGVISGYRGREFNIPFNLTGITADDGPALRVSNRDTGQRGIQVFKGDAVSNRYYSQDGDGSTNGNVFDGGVRVNSGNLFVAGTTTLTGNTSIGGTLTVTGATQLNSTLGVVGATTLSSTLSVAGLASLNADAIVKDQLQVQTAGSVNLLDANASLGTPTLTVQPKMIVQSTGGTALLTADASLANPRVDVGDTGGSVGSADASTRFRVLGGRAVLMGNGSTGVQLVLTYAKADAEATTGWKIGASASSNPALVLFGDDNNQRMRITDGGSLIVSNSVTSSSYQLDVVEGHTNLRLGLKVGTGTTPSDTTGNVHASAGISAGNPGSTPGTGDIFGRGNLRLVDPSSTSNYRNLISNGTSFQISGNAGSGTDMTIDSSSVVTIKKLTVDTGPVSLAGNLTVDTSTLVVDATNNFVGINTASPGNGLEISSSTLIALRVNGSGNTATTATAGAQTLPSNPVGFWIVNLDGTSRKIPYYAT